MPPPPSSQPSTSGLGKQFTSPIKRQDKRKTTTYVQYTGRKQEIARLRAKLDMLKKQTEVDPVPPSMPLDMPASAHNMGPEPSTNDGDGPVAFDDLLPGPECVATTQEAERPPRRTVPNQAAKDTYANWAALLTRLVNPLLGYTSKSLGRIPERVSSLKAVCKAEGSCMMRTNKVLCLFQDYFQKFTVEWCSCEELPYVLITNGLFPTAPLYPRIAISIHLLDFYRALFERSCDAVNAMASALNTFYGQRGFIVTDKKGVPVQDPFRRGLGYAAQWYDNLQIRLEQQVDGVILDADTCLQGREVITHTADPFTAPLYPTPPDMSTITYKVDLSPGQCARLLQQRCPCCFEGNLFGRSLEHHGGDIQVCVDGNFNHRHLQSAGDSPHFYEPDYILSKEFIDSIGIRIEQL